MLFFICKTTVENQLIIVSGINITILIKANSTNVQLGILFTPKTCFTMQMYKIN